MEEIVKEMGFESLKEYHYLVSNVDLSSADKLEAFEQWKERDGTKAGLLNLQKLKTE